MPRPHDPEVKQVDQSGSREGAGLLVYRILAILCLGVQDKAFYVMVLNLMEGEVVKSLVKY